MKRSLAVLTFALSVAGYALAQDYLSVEVKNSILFFNNEFNSTAVMQSRWIPYLNGRRISESSFYRRVGDSIAAEAQKQREIKYSIFVGGGSAAMYAGCAVLVTSLFLPGSLEPFSENPRNLTLAIVSGSLLAGGFLWTIPGWSSEGNYYSEPYAEKLVSDFNSDQ